MTRFGTRFEPITSPTSGECANCYAINSGLLLPFIIFNETEYSSKTSYKLRKIFIPFSVILKVGSDQQIIRFLYFLSSLKSLLMNMNKKGVCFIISYKYPFILALFCFLYCLVSSPSFRF